RVRLGRLHVPQTRADSSLTKMELREGGQDRWNACDHLVRVSIPSERAVSRDLSGCLRPGLRPWRLRNSRTCCADAEPIRTAHLGTPGRRGGTAADRSQGVIDSTSCSASRAEGLPQLGKTS